MKNKSILYSYINKLAYKYNVKRDYFIYDVGFIYRPIIKYLEYYKYNLK